MAEPRDGEKRRRPPSAGQPAPLLVGCTLDGAEFDLGVRRCPLGGSLDGGTGWRRAAFHGEPMLESSA